MDLDEKEILLQKLAEINAKKVTAETELEIARKKLEEYEEKTKKAENASRMKSLFLANMSHEIRTPLNAIEGFSRIMAETDSADERMKYMEIVESNNNRLMALINEILDLSRVEAGELTIKKGMTDLSELCKSLKMIFKFRCSEGVDLIWTQPNMKVTLNTDVNRLTQVFSNLISNALKHTTKGTITYGYRLINDGQEVEFFVSDTGTGISPEDQKHIFETYVSRDAEKQAGYGLGLTLCKTIVERMEGTISVQSELGKGSTFRFILPFEGMRSSHDKYRRLKLKLAAEAADRGQYDQAERYVDEALLWPVHLGVGKPHDAAIDHSTEDWLRGEIQKRREGRDRTILLSPQFGNQQQARDKKLF